MSTKGFNWYARRNTDRKVKIDRKEEKKINLDPAVFGDVQNDDCNVFALPSRKRKTKVVDAVVKKKKVLTKKQRKNFEKIVERKEKKTKRAGLLEQIASVQASEQVIRNLISTTSMQTHKEGRKAGALDDVDMHEADLPNSTSNIFEGATGKKFKKLNQKKWKEEEKEEDEIDTSDVSTDEEEEEAVADDDAIKNQINGILTTKDMDEVDDDAMETQVKDTDTACGVEARKEGTDKKGCAGLGGTSAGGAVRGVVHVAVTRDHAIQLQRKQLPIYGEEQVVMELINDNDVVIVCGETGSGKTTQVPQFLYEAGYAHNGGIIAVTEPRRVAAVSMAARVAMEMSLSQKEVSYQIRYEGTANAGTKIKFMTDGVLLKEVQHDFELSAYSAVVLDEAHERSVYTDILLAFLSRIVRLRRKQGKPLKLILMSATLQVSTFTLNKRLFATPPPLLQIDARQYPVSIHFNKRTPSDYMQEAFKKTCKIHERLPEGGVLVFVTSQREVHQLCSKLKRAYPRLVKEEEEEEEEGEGAKSGSSKRKDRRRRSVGKRCVEDEDGEEVDGEDGEGEKSAKNYEEKKMINDEAKSVKKDDDGDDDEKKVEYGLKGPQEEDNKPLLNTPLLPKLQSSSAFPMDEDDDDNDAVECDDNDAVEGNDNDAVEGDDNDAGEFDDNDAVEGDDNDAGGGDDNGSEAARKDNGVDDVYLSEEELSGDDEYFKETTSTCKPLYVLPLFSLLSSDKQALVFQAPPKGCRLVVVATNVAETSITIPNIKYVVDTGKVKVKLYDPVTGISSFKVTSISQASANQRSGRAGRTAPGHCYRLYSSAVFTDFEKFSEPEIRRRPVEDVVLQLKDIGVDRVKNFPFPTPPPPDAVEAAEKLLYSLGALAPFKAGKTREMVYRLTDLGRTISHFPVSPRFAKMLALGHQRPRLLAYIVVMVAGLSVQEVFVEEYEEAKEEEEEEEEGGRKVLSSSMLKRRKWLKKGEQLLLGDVALIVKAICLFENCHDNNNNKRNNTKITTFSSNENKKTNVGSMSDEAGALFCEEFGVSMKAMIEVRRLRRQLTNLLNTLLNLDLPLHTRLPPPSASTCRLLRQVLLAGMVDQVARRMPDATGLGSEEARKRKHAYEHMSLTDPVFIHPSSILHKSKHRYIIYQHLHATSRLYLKGVTVVEAEWLATFVPSSVVFKEPLKGLSIETSAENSAEGPSYDERSGSVVCMMNATFGAQFWELPKVKSVLPKSIERTRWFARFLLEGEVCPVLRPFAKLLLTPPSTMLKPWAHLQPRTTHLLQALFNRDISDKEALLAFWKKKPDFLLSELKEWLPSTQHATLTSLWPPL